MRSDSLLEGQPFRQAGLGAADDGQAKGRDSAATATESEVRSREAGSCGIARNAWPTPEGAMKQVLRSIWRQVFRKQERHFAMQTRPLTARPGLDVLGRAGQGSGHHATFVKRQLGGQADVAGADEHCCCLREVGKLIQKVPVPECTGVVS